MNKKRNKIIIFIGTIILVSGIAIFIPKSIVDNPIVAMLIYLFAFKGVLLGMGCDNVNYITNNPLPNATCYIPYVQVINLCETKSLLVAYYITMIFPVIIMSVGMLNPILNLFDYTNVETYLNTLQWIAIGDVVIWRLISFKIHSDVYRDLCELVESQTHTEKGIIGKIIDVIVNASFLFPGLSVLGSVNIYLESMRARNNTNILKKRGRVS